MNIGTPKKRYSLGEEIFSSITHGFGTLLAVAGLVLMVVFSVMRGDGYCIASSIIYGATLIILYLSSTLYHAFTNERVKQILRIFDHSSIFLLIAGTYTPYTLVALNGKPIGWSLFAVIWGAAVLGIVLNAIDLKKFAFLSLILYLCMGWAVVLAIKPLIHALPLPGIWLLLAGGLAYTLGVIFYVIKKYKYMHSIWHLFVLAGSILHFFSIFLYVLP